LAVASMDGCIDILRMGADFFWDLVLCFGSVVLTLWNGI